MAKGYSQLHGINYNEKNCLARVLKKKIYMKQSDFVVKCNEDKIFKLKKLLYGIKQY
jgi:hypothetical protein